GTNPQLSGEHGLSGSFFLAQRFGDPMNRRPLSCNWTEEDRLTWFRWRRHMAVFYGSAALLIFGIIVLTKAVEPGARSGKPLADCAGQSGRRPVGESAMKTAALANKQLTIRDQRRSRVSVEADRCKAS